MQADAGAPQTYGPAAVAAAAGVARGLFQSWLARHYVRVTSRGAGRSREFSFEDAVMIAAIAALDRSGVAVGTAADQLHQLRGEFGLAVSEALANVDKIIVIAQFGTETSVSTLPRQDIALALKPVPGGDEFHPVIFTIIDLATLVRRVRAKLDA